MPDIDETLRLSNEYMESLNVLLSSIDPTTAEQWYGWHLAVMSAVAHAALYRAGLTCSQQTPDGPRNRHRELRLKILDLCHEYVVAEKPELRK
jgi:hypothetical protein